MENFNDIPKKNCFKTPNGYFKNLEEEIKAKTIDGDEFNRTGFFSKFEIVKPYVYLAAGMIALVFIIRLGLEIGVGDYQESRRFPAYLVTESSFKEDYIDNIALNQMEVMNYIFDDEEDFFEDIDNDYLEEYLAKYAYEFKLYNDF